ncbi:MAG: helix-turn-helix domain-containing protein [Rikenellaceae bacterium]
MKMTTSNFEKSAFERLMHRMERFAEKIERLSDDLGDKHLKRWLDNQEVCEILNIRTRTLQSYRDSGKLAFSQIGHKIYYRPDDVLKLLKST